MIDRDFALAFAEEWITAWNAHDLERVLSHYNDDFVMSSPFIASRGFDPSGTLHGKAAVWPYWEQSLSMQPPLHFELVEVLVGASSLTLLYRRQTGQLAAETLIFDESGQIVQGIAHHALGYPAKHD